jgi:hypothetical protein
VVVLAEDLAEYLFEPFQGNTREVFFVKALIGKVELFPKGFPIKQGLSVESEDVVGGGKDGREVVHECPRPIEDEITDQGKRRKKGGT